MNFWILLSFILVSCSTPGPEMVEEERLEGIYRSSGIEQFFLVDLPHWANFSKAGQCHRQNNIRYLHFENLNKSYNLNYTQIIHLQHMFNRKLYAYKASASSNEIPFKDESFVFYNVYQQVLGASYDFTPPKFKKVSVVWVDPFLKDQKKLKKIINSERVLEGHPVLLSHCLTSYQLEELAQKLEVDKLGVKFISADMLSIYNNELSKDYDFALNLNEILKNKEIKFFSSKQSSSIKGDFDFVEVK